MKKILIILIVGILITSIISVSSLSDQYVDAGSRKKIHFTQTISSSQDPGLEHENHQLAFILSPNEGTLYDGSMTFTSSESVNIFVLHKINPNDVKGQDTWTINENPLNLRVLDLHYILQIQKNLLQLLVLMVGLEANLLKYLYKNLNLKKKILHYYFQDLMFQLQFQCIKEFTMEMKFFT